MPNDQETKPTAALEVTGAIIRVFADGGEFGAPFSYAVSVVGDEGTATLKALRGDGLNIDKAQREAIKDSLREAGFKKAVWRRHKDGATREVEVAL